MVGLKGWGLGLCYQRSWKVIAARMMDQGIY